MCAFFMLHCSAAALFQVCGLCLDSNSEPGGSREELVGVGASLSRTGP